MGDLEKQERVMEEEEKERLLEGVAVLDFDVLCSTVALRAAHGKWGKLGVEEEEEESGEFGGVLRMWEGEVLDCFDDHRIALESTCCPCYRFGKNMKRAGFGSCYIQAAIYFILAIGAFLNFVAFAVTRRHCHLYLAVAFVVSVGAYLGFFRTRIRKKFNIMIYQFEPNKHRTKTKKQTTPRRDGKSHNAAPKQEPTPPHIDDENLKRHERKTRSMRKITYLG